MGSAATDMPTVKQPTQPSPPPPQPPRQHIRIQTINQILQPQPQLRIPFNHQSPPKKQRIRVLLPTGQQQKLPPIPTDRHLGSSLRSHPQPLPPQRQIPTHPQIRNTQAHPTPTQQIETSIAQRLRQTPIKPLLQHQPLRGKRHPPNQRQHPIHALEHPLLATQHPTTSSTRNIPACPCQ